MNEPATLSAGHESALVFETVALLKKRIRGGTHNIIFENPDAPYLALGEKGSWEFDPDELTTISIHEALHISAGSFLKRTKLEEVHFTAVGLKRIYDRIMSLLNEKIGPIIAHPYETKEIIAQIEQLKSDTTLIVHYLEKILEKHYNCDDAEEQLIYTRLIDEYLQMLQEKKARIQEIPQIYSLPGEFYEGDFVEAKSEFTPQSTGFFPVKRWTGDEDEGGGLEDLAGSELVIENMPLSEAEYALLMRCPKDFFDIDEIFQENFSWSIIGAETARERSRDIKDHPNVLEKKYRMMLRRKEMIYFYIKKIYDLHQREKQGGKHQFITPIIGIRDIIRFLPVLKSEIDALREKIGNVSPTVSKKKTNKKTTQVSEAAIKEKIQNLSQRKTNTMRERDTYLTSFFYISGSEELFTPMIQELNKQIELLAKKLHNYIKALHVPVNFDALSSTSSKKNVEPVHVDKLFNNPQFFEKIPQTVEAPLTSVESDLIKMCDLCKEFSRFKISNGITTITNSYTTDDANEEEKMEGLLGIFETIISRKMFIYSQVFPFLPEDFGHPIHELLDALREEIEVAEMSKRILLRRVKWMASDGSKGSDITEEIEELWDRRFYQLKHYFTQQGNAPSRSHITGALTNTIESLLERQQDRDELELEDGDGEGIISMPEVTSAEQQLIQYVPEDIKKNDKIFYDSISYHIDPDSTHSEQKEEKQRILLTHICERLLVIYFFAQSTIDVIDFEMAMNTDIDENQAQTSTQVREAIETALKPMKQAIIDNLAALGGHKKPKKIEPPRPLYDRSIFIFSKLDGLQAHTSNTNQDVVNTCWRMVQDVVRLFSDEIHKNKTEKNDQIRPIQLNYRRKMTETRTAIIRELRKKLPQKEAESEFTFIKKMLNKIDKTLFGIRALVGGINK